MNYRVKSIESLNNTPDLKYYPSEDKMTIYRNGDFYLTTGSQGSLSPSTIFDEESNKKICVSSEDYTKYLSGYIFFRGVEEKFP